MIDFLLEHELLKIQILKTSKKFFKKTTLKSQLVKPWRTQNRAACL